jgi:hypothetical protein
MQQSVQLTERLICYLHWIIGFRVSPVDTSRTRRFQPASEASGFSGREVFPIRTSMHYPRSNASRKNSVDTIGEVYECPLCSIQSLEFDVDFWPVSACDLACRIERELSTLSCPL